MPKTALLSTFVVRPGWTLAGALLTVFLLLGPSAAPTWVDAVVPLAKVPADGPYLVRLAHSGMCVSEDPANSSGIDFQTACADAFPPISLARQESGRYRLTTAHPRFGPGCVSVSGADPSPGAVVANGYCNSGDAVEYDLRPVAKPLSGFRIRPVHSGLCLGVPGNSRQNRAPVRQLRCDSAAAGQVFRFDPRR